MKRKGQQTIAYEGKRYKVYCECNLTDKELPYSTDKLKYELHCVDIPSCPDCSYHPWIRLGKKEKSS